MSLSHELVMGSASAIASDPTKIFLAIPALIGGGATAAKAFTIVHQSEMGVCTRKGAPMLKPEIAQRILMEISQDLTVNSSQQTVIDIYRGSGGLSFASSPESVALDLPEDEATAEHVPSFPVYPAYNLSRGVIKDLDLPKGLVRDKKELRKRMGEKIADLPEEVREAGIYQIVGQGIVWLRPFIDRVVKINVTSQTTPLESFELDCEDGPLVNLKPAVTWQVRTNGDNVYKAIFHINNDKETAVKNKTQELEQTVEWICADGLTQVLRARNHDQVRNYDRTELTKSVREICGNDLLRFGVHMSDIWMKHPAPLPVERFINALKGSNGPEKAIALATAASVAGKGLENVVPLHGHGGGHGGEAA